MIEFGSMRQLTHIVTVTDARMERILCRARWPLKRLGAPRRIGKTIAVAGYLEVSPERLRDVREAGGLSAPAICEVGVRIGHFTPSDAMERAVA
jgi:acyl homoserine lactone synthase